MNPELLNLTLPTQSSHVDPTLPLSPRELEEWIRNLPIADVAGTTRQVFQAVVGTNGTRLAPALRADLLDRHATQVQEIRDALLPHFVGQPHPLPLANRRIVVSLEKLFRNLATGYEIVVREASEELAARSVHGAVCCLRDALTVGYLGYQTPAPGVWQELHELYRYGIRLTTHQTPGWDAPYKEALLLDLADPNRLTPAELQLTTAVARALAPEARLLAPATVPPNGGGVYVVAFAADTGPVEPEDYDLGADPLRGQVLDASAVATRLARAIDQLSAGEPVVLPEPLRDKLVTRNLPFLERLVKLYAQRPRRQHQRTYGDSAIEIVKGVSALHSMVNDPDQPSEDEAILMTGDARSGVNLGTDTGYSADHWRQINHSAQGVGLLHGPDGQHRVQVGDLLGLKGLDGSDHWVPAIVRRLRYSNDDLVVGAQLIAPNVHATHARMVGGKDRDQAALLVQRQTDGKRQTLVISQREFLQAEKPITLTVKDRQIEVRPRTLVESSDFLDIYELASAGAAQGDPPQ